MIYLVLWGGDIYSYNSTTSICIVVSIILYITTFFADENNVCQASSFATCFLIPFRTAQWRSHESGHCPFCGSLRRRHFQLHWGGSSAEDKWRTDRQGEGVWSSLQGRHHRWDRQMGNAISNRISKDFIRFNYVYFIKCLNQSVADCFSVLNRTGI